MILPSELEQLILTLVDLPHFNRDVHAVSKKRVHDIRKQLYKLSADFAQLKPTADRYCDAYFIYNFPMNVMKVMKIINELQYLHPSLFSNKGEVKILDVGCGEGAALIGTYYSLSHATRLSMTGIDLSRHMLQRCQRIVDRLSKKNPRIKVRLHRQNVSRGFFTMNTTNYDVIIFANSLAEICKDNTISLKFIESVQRHLTANGIIIIIEPALKHLSRRLMKLRDEILLNKKGSVLVPCLHSSPCPLFSIRAQKEWCHEIRSWQPPEYMKCINQKLHREIHRLKFSYLVIGKQAGNITFSNGFRVVSRLLKEKGKQRCFLCTPKQRVELVRLDKSTGTQNREFSSIQKGDIISVDNIMRKRFDYWQICRHTGIKIIYRTDHEQ